MNDYSQLDLVHRLPPASLVDRFVYLSGLAERRRVMHIGFADAGFQNLNEESGAWLHAHLAGTAREIIGLDLDETAVQHAVSYGYEARVVDCCDANALRALGLERADVVVAGEVIEHVDNVGSFLEALHELLTPDGILVVTTPNGSGLVNALAALASLEVNHPDHVTMFSCNTLDTMMRRHGWEPIEHRVFVQQIKSKPDGTLRSRVLTSGGRAVLALQRVLARTGMPYVANGLIVVARPVG